MKKKLIIIGGILIIFIIGFISGMEYQAYMIKSSISEAFDTNTNNESSQTPTNTESDTDEEEEIEYIDEEVGNEITLATGNITIESSEEVQSISSSYGSPEVASEGTKFVIVELSVTNTTNSEFMFDPDDVFVLVDSQDREYRTFSDTIGNIENYLNVRDLAPSITETGMIVYNIPEDASSYNLITRKAGSDEIYRIQLK